MDTNWPPETLRRWTVRVELSVNPSLGDGRYPDVSLGALLREFEEDGHRMLDGDVAFEEWLEMEMTFTAWNGLEVVEDVIEYVGRITGDWLVDDVQTLAVSEHPTFEPDPGGRR